MSIKDQGGNEMKNKKWMSLSLVLLLIVSLMMGCSSTNKETDTTGDANTAADTTSKTDDKATTKDVAITLLNTKGEIATQLEDAAKAFMVENPGITLEIIPAGAGQSPFEKLSTMYNSGNAPSLAMVDGADVGSFSEKFLDLSNEKWVADSASGTLDMATIDGKVKSFPFTVEGFGFIYNKAVLDKAGVDPTTLTTQTALEDAFVKVEASGAKALVIAPMDWSLGAHFMGLAYANYSTDWSKVTGLVDELRAGTADLSTNKSFNGMLDLFDIMKKYNATDDPLAVTYEKGPEMLGKSEIGFWFMGNWAWPQINDANAGGSSFGFVPAPVSNDPAEYGNTQISVAPSKYISIDGEQNSPEQQAAALKFLDWLVYSPTGQDNIVNKMSIIPAFNNVTLEPTDPLGISIKGYLNDSKTIKNTLAMPGDHWAKVGAIMQKYLVDQADRAETLNSIQEYWKTAQ